MFSKLMSVAVVSVALVVALPARGDTPIEMQIGGVGGAYFLAEPGELTIEVLKRDRNRRATPTELRAVLAGPDRKVLQDVTIPDDGLPADGKLGPAQAVRLSTRVERKGVYALNVTVSNDRYGEAMVWGFRTNCPKYLVETSRGHRDERHMEPIVLYHPGQLGDVCFLPRRGEFGIEIAGLPSGAEAPTLFDGHDKLVATLKRQNGGQAVATIPADPRREPLPWRLHLPEQQATIHIDGLTRWESRDLCPDHALWTPEAKSFFPLHAYRWLVTPYSRLVYGQAGAPGETAFRVHNNSDREKTIRLQIEFPQSPWQASLSTDRVVLPAKTAKEVVVRHTVPSEGQTCVCHVRATPEEDADFSTYSTLTVRAGEAPSRQPIALPLVLKPYEHENEQFGHVPDFPVENQVYFDPNNRPFTWTSAGPSRWRDGKWTATSLQVGAGLTAAPEGIRSFGMATPKIAFDRDGDVYVLGVSGNQAALLHSRDGGRSFAAYLIPNPQDKPRALDIEQCSGHNLPDGPPPILSFTHTKSDPKRIWRRFNDLELHLPGKVDGRITFGEPILLSKDCLGLAAHSGTPSCVVSRGDKVHAVWAEATDPDQKLPGAPTYAVTFDRSTRTLGRPALVGYGPPANDVHNTPSITIDSQGYLHVLAGTHGQPFPYARSLKPNDAQSGWTEPVLTGEGLPQTYVGLVCGPDDTLHAVFRLWQRGKAPFPLSHYATLAYQRKPPGKPWEAPRVLIVPPLSEYSVFYHRLTIDRRGRLFLSYDYWSTHWFYRNDQPGSRRTVMMSPDGGQTWKLATTADLAP